MNQQRLTVLLQSLVLFVPLLVGCYGNGGSSSPDNTKGASKETNENATASSASGGQEQSKNTNQERHKLFIIERSKNENIVRYDAQLTDKGTLDPDKPVTAYWIMHAEKGQRVEMTWMERKMAYGFETKPASSGEGYILTMVPLPEREIRIRSDGETIQAQIKINGHPSVLEKIYVDADSGLTGPSVNYVKLFGRDLETGEKRTEKITPD